ncbi:MAG TPA: SGNH/GDSL hydrolase family protein [Clostridia bacterium]|nr:SGNH/GDSL hydrolase family protein [Clostridia bacterium]
MLIKKNQKVLMIGDSVTDCNRRDQNSAYLGHAYPHIVASKFYLEHPDMDVEVINKGISGDTSKMLLDRWQVDVVDMKPDILTILIGINDVWRHYDTPDVTRRVSKEDYIKNMRFMIESMIDKTKKIIILSPFYLEENMSKPMKAQAHDYIVALRALVKEYDVLFIDLQKEFEKLMKKYTYDQLTFKTDKIHPTMFGQYVIATLIYDTLTK